jgi:hypothetical protein
MAGCACRRTKGMARRRMMRHCGVWAGKIAHKRAADRERLKTGHFSHVENILSGKIKKMT